MPDPVVTTTTRLYTRIAYAKPYISTPRFQRAVGCSFIHAEVQSPALETTLEKLFSSRSASGNVAKECQSRSGCLESWMPLPKVVVV